MKIAVIQMRSGVDISANLDAAETLIRAAAKEGARFIATPEMTHIVQRSPKRLFASITEETDDLGVKHFGALAKELSIDLLIGSLAIKTGEARAANRSFLFDGSGQIKARYDKIHLFDVTVSRRETWKESNVYDRGDRAVVAEIEGARLGLSICYDLRFPALYRHYAQSGADILTVPAAFTKPTGEAHWESLLRARAIETGSFVIAPAQGGLHEDGRTTYGHSLIIGPWGDIKAQLKHDEPDFICVDIDLEDAADARRRIPAWDYNPDYSR
jgi:predicted amidohydrolase